MPKKSYNINSFLNLLGHNNISQLKEALDIATTPQKTKIFNFKNIAGRTPLLLAAQMGRAEIVALLLDHGASIKEVDKNGNNVLQTSVYHKHTIEIFHEIFSRFDCEELLTQKNKQCATLMDLCVQKVVSSEIIFYLVDKAKKIETLQVFEQAVNKFIHKPSAPEYLILIQEKIKALSEQQLLNDAIGGVNIIGGASCHIDKKDGTKFKL